MFIRDLSLCSWQQNCHTDSTTSCSRETELMQTLLQDIRYGLRILWKSPGFTLVAVLTLALGIGANTAIFSIVNSVLLRPLPFPQPDQLVSLNEKDMRSDLKAGAVVNTSYPDFFDWRSQNRVFENMAAFRYTSSTLIGAGTPLHIDAEIVTAEFFTVLGVPPSVGRGFRPEEENGRFAVLSHELWQSKYSSDPEIAGKSITLQGKPYTVVGVAAEGFRFPIDSRAPQLWTTLGEDTYAPAGDKPATTLRGQHMFDVIARLKPGVSLDQAQAEMNVIAEALARQYPNDNGKRFATAVLPEKERLVGDTRPALLMLLAAVGCVLLIACANIANLMLARATKRSKEIAIRAALGAGRSRVIRQLLTESVLLALAGGTLGLIFSALGMRVLLRLSPEDVPRLAQSGLDWHVLVFTLLVAVATGLVFGLAPGIHASRTNLSGSLHERSQDSGGGQHRLRAALVVAETAMGLILLVGAGLLIRSFYGLLHANPGFDPHHVLTLRVNLPDSRYSEEKQIAFYHDLLESLQALPGVVSAGGIVPLPLTRSDINTTFAIEGRPVPEAEEPSAGLRVISPSYFQTMKIPLIRGRAFDARDSEKAPPVVIINEELARRFFPNEDPVGKRIRPGVSVHGNPPMREIVGVVGGVKDRSLRGEFRPEFYVAYPQAMILDLTICMRTVGDPTKLTGAVQNSIASIASMNKDLPVVSIRAMDDYVAAAARNQIASMDKELPVFNIRTMEDYIGVALGKSRFDTLLLTLFASLALVLTMVGIYGVMAYTVVQRTREIGIRIALGATRGDVVRMVLGKSFVITGLGLLLGIAGATALTRLLSSFLYHVRAVDPLTFITVSVLLGAISLVASYIPAWRAARVDPMVALRYE
jgi:predicted permease